MCVCVCVCVYIYIIGIFNFFQLGFFLFCFVIRATPVAYGGSQARGLIGAAAASLYHSPSNTTYKLHITSSPKQSYNNDLGKG